MTALAMLISWSPLPPTPRGVAPVFPPLAWGAPSSNPKPYLIIVTYNVGVKFSSRCKKRQKECEKEQFIQSNAKDSKTRVFCYTLSV